MKRFTRFFASRTQTIRKATRRRDFHPRVTVLEDRLAPAGVEVWTDALPAQEVRLGDGNITGNLIHLSPTTYTRLDSVDLVPAYGSVGLRAVSGVSFAQDFEGDGIGDRELPVTWTFTDGGYIRVGFDSHDLLRPGQVMHLVQTFGLREDAEVKDGDCIGLELGNVELLNLDGTNIAQSDISYAGVQPGPLHSIVVEQPKPQMVIDMHVGDLTATDGDNDVVLGVLEFYTDGPTIIDALPFSLQGNHDDGTGFVVSGIWEDLEVRNKRTGFVVHAQAGPEGYILHNLPVYDGDLYEVRGDIEQIIPGTLRQGDSFNVMIRMDQIEATDAATGSDVEILPGGVIQTPGRTRVYYPSLGVRVLASPTADTTTVGQRVKLVRFDAVAGPGGDILLTEVSFRPTSGNLGVMRNYDLFVDTDSDGATDTRLQLLESANGQLTFSNMVGGGYIVPEGRSVMFEVYATAAYPGSLSLGFDTGRQCVAAEKISDGSSLVGLTVNGPSVVDHQHQISLWTAPSTTWTVTTSGDLYVSKSTEPIRPRFLLLGDRSDRVLSVRFYAEHERIEIYRLWITAVGGENVERFNLVVNGAVIATATVGGVGTDSAPTTINGVPAITFGANMQQQQLVVPEGQDVRVDFVPVMKTDEQGGRSGQPLYAAILDIPGAVLARGVANNLLPNTPGASDPAGSIHIPSDIVGTRHVTTGAEMSKLENVDPNPHGTSVPTGVADVFQIRVSAAPNSNTRNGLDDVLLRGMTIGFHIQNVDIDLTSFRLRNKADSSIWVGATSVSTVGGVLYVTFGNLSSVNAEIDQGTSQTFVVSAVVRNPQISSTQSSSLQGVLDPRNGLQWAAVDASSQVEFDWTDFPDLVKGTVYGAPAQSAMDVAVTMAGPVTVVAGGNLTYSIVVRNYGPGTAQGKVRQSIPAGLTYVDASSDPIVDQQGAEIVGPFTLAAGQVKMFVVTYAVTSDLSDGSTISASARAVVAGDVNLTNNTSQVVVTRVTVPPQPQVLPLPQCNDGVDNDADGRPDFPLDPGCSHLGDTDELDRPLPVALDPDAIDTLFETNEEPTVTVEPIEPVSPVDIDATPTVSQVVPAEPVPTTTASPRKKGKHQPAAQFKSSMHEDIYWALVGMKEDGDILPKKKRRLFAA